MLRSSHSLTTFGLLAALLGAPAEATSAENACSPTTEYLRSASAAAVKPTVWCWRYLGIEANTVLSTTTKAEGTTATITKTVGTITVPDSITATADAVTVTSMTTVTNAPVTVVVTTCTEEPGKKMAAHTTRPRPARNAVPAPNQIIAANTTYPPVPTWLPDWSKSDVAKACKCLCLESPAPSVLVTTEIVDHDITVTSTVKDTKTSTVTVTPTITAQSTITESPSTTSDYCPPTTPPTCNNDGLQWAYFYNPWGNNGDSTYSQYDPTYCKTVTPNVSGVAEKAGGFSGTCGGDEDTLDFYGNEEPCQLFSLNYCGYLYAPQSGNFTIELTQADDIVLIWAGDIAYSGWTRSNAIFDYTYSTLGEGQSVEIPLNAGAYTPLRVIMAQGYGPFGFAIKITAPDGTVILSPDSSSSNYLQEYPCNPIFGAPYPPYGSET